MATPVAAPTTRRKITNRLHFDSIRRLPGCTGPGWTSMAPSGGAQARKRNDEPPALSVAFTVKLLIPIDDVLMRLPFGTVPVQTAIKLGRPASWQLKDASTRAPRR